MGQASRQFNKQFNEQLPAHTLIILSRNLWGITAATEVKCRWRKSSFVCFFVSPWLVSLVA